MYVAVVVRKDGSPSEAPDKQWAAFVHADRDIAVNDAIEKVQQWSRGRRYYTILVGELTAEVVPQQQYRTRPIPMEIRGLEDHEIGAEVNVAAPMKGDRVTPEDF